MTHLPVQFVSAADGSRVGYAVSGHGRELVHVPFTFGNTLQRRRANAFDAWYDGLAERFRLIRYDGRGHGYGERDIQSFTLEELILDLEAVINAEVKAPSFYLLGSFFWVNAALEFARRHPDRLRGLILWTPYTSKTKRTTALAYIADNDWAVFLRNMAMANHFVRDDEELRAEMDELGAALSRHEFMVMRHDFEAMPDVEPLLTQVSTPTLLIKAQDVTVTYETEIVEMASRMPRASAVVFEGSAACPIGPLAGPTLEAIDTFVAECEQAAGGLAWTPVTISVSNGLSRREVEITRLVAQGRSNAEIASELTLSTRTVERHVQNIYNKLGVHNRVEAANWAMRHRVR